MKEKEFYNVGMDLFPVFKKGFAMRLKDMGFRIEDAKSNDRNPNYVIYYFEKTKEFIKAFNNLNNK